MPPKSDSVTRASAKPGQLEDAQKEIAELKAQLGVKNTMVEKYRSEVTKLRKENFELKANRNGSERNGDRNGDSNGQGGEHESIRQIEMAMRMHEIE